MSSFEIKIRGTRPQGRARVDYYCEEHGYFEAQVDHNDHGDVPETLECTHPIPSLGGAPHATDVCGLPAVRCVGAPLARVNPIEAIKGKWQKPERPTWTDTRNLGEGQPLYEWREDRAKVWEEKRKQDVMAFAREVHERPIGGD